MYFDEFNYTSRRWFALLLLLLQYIVLEMPIIIIVNYIKKI